VLSLLISFSSAEALEAYVTAEAVTVAGAEQASTAEARKKLLFLHIPKNAGTTIEELGFEAGLSWGKYNDVYHGKSMNNLYTLKPEPGEPEPICSVWHVPPQMFHAPNPYEDPNFEVFCVVRDPWERLISEFMYRWKIRNETDEHLTGCEPDTFASWLNNMLDLVESGHGSACDCHMIPQSEYIRGSSGHAYCKHILKMDNLEEEFNELMRKFKLDVRIDGSDKDNEDNDAECSAIQEAPLTKLFPSQLQRRVRLFFAEDFAHIGDSIASHEISNPFKGILTRHRHQRVRTRHRSHRQQQHVQLPK